MTEPYRLEAFVDEVRDAMSRGLAAEAALRALTPPFKRLLANRSFLEQALSRVAPSGDEARLHHDPQHGFVVLARGIGARRAHAGQSHAVMPHDHGPLWALYGLYRGSARMQRYEPDPREAGERFPGLRLVSDVLAHAGDVDAIEPHRMHLPVFLEEGGTVIVVYNGVLEAVTRRGYVAARAGVVEFRGVFPPGGAPGEGAMPSDVEAGHVPGVRP